MKYQKSNQAFTLIEIFVVLIILGVIAALAFPGIFAQIERQRGQEALNSMNLIKSSMESCGLQNSYDFVSCIYPASGTVWDTIGMAAPAATNFNYSVVGTPSGCNVTPPCSGYNITATRTTSSDTITVTRASTGISTCAGVGAFGGFCS